MTNGAEVGIGGYFKLEAVNAETGERRVLADWFKNLITDIGLNRMGSAGFISHCYVGSGSTPPANSDTQMQSFVAVAGSVQAYTNGYTAGPPFYGWVRQTWRFSQGAAAGNLSEVGIGWSTTHSGALYSRSLIKDGNGNPTTITVLASEFLDVTYEFRVYPPQSDSTFQVTISGQTYDCTLRAARVSSTSTGLPVGNLISTGVQYQPNFGGSEVYSGTLGAATSSPTGGTGINLNGYTNSTYVSNSFQRNGTLALGLNEGNIAGGIKCLGFQTLIGGFQVQFTPNIMKDATKLLTFNLRVSWARRP
jgi:hypothetical protein